MATTEDINLAIDIHADGTPLVELARVFGVSTSTIKRMLVESGGS